MKGYSENTIFTLEEIKLWEKATLAVGSLPENDELRCHELARAVQVFLQSERPKLIIVDGKFGLVDHSWLVVETYHREILLDVYAVGSLPIVQLIDRGSMAIRPARQYIEGNYRLDIDNDAVRKLVLQMTMALKR